MELEITRTGPGLLVRERWGHMDLVEALSSLFSETLIIYNLSLVEEEKDF